MLPSTLPSVKTPLYDDLAFNNPSSDYLRRRLISFACITNKIISGLLQSIETIIHTWSLSTSRQSALFKSKIFAYYMVVLD